MRPTSSLRLLILLCGSAFLAWSGAAQAESRCEIYHDAQDINHVRALGDPAQGEAGAIRCLGYLHGRDRAFQMDYFRRAAQGRLSEILGSHSVKMDFTMRLLGLKENADRLARELSPRTRELFSAYAEGVRAGMAKAVEQGVYEFQDLHYKPEPWTVEDSLSVALLQSFDQTRRSVEEKRREAQAREKLGASVESLMRIDDVPWFTTVIKPDETGLGSRPKADSGRKSASLSPAPSLGRNFPPAPSESKGSNNWAIAPSRSETGRAWFANDPHLDLRYPSFWYWAEIRGGSWDAVGASLPGIPVLASGANAHLAWGLTNSYIDTMDVYEVPEEDLRSANTIRPVVWLKVLGPVRVPIFFKSFQRTREGWPVLPLPGPEGKAIVLRWSGFDLKGDDFDGFFEMLASGSAPEFDRALTHIGLPSWNLTFADSAGQIGYRVIGRVPKRAKAEPFGYHPIRLAEAPKWEFLNAEEMPHLLNPKRGYIATANNAQWPEGTPFADGRRQASGFRAYRIEELLRARPKHDLASLQAIQCDDTAVDARFFLPSLLKLASGWQDLVPREKEALGLLKSWDLRTGLECRACGVFRFWLNGIYDRKGWDATILGHVISHPQDFAVEAREAFSQTVKLLVPEGSPEFPRWGEIHRASFPHFAGEELYPHDPIPTVGDENTVNPGSGPQEGRFIRHKGGASERMVMEMQSPPRVWRVLPGFTRDVREVNLNAPGSPWQNWASCKLDPVTFPLAWDNVGASGGVEEIHF